MGGVRMFFRDYFNSIVDCLDAKFKGMQRKGQNPVDRGELCEMFLKDFLCDLFSNQFEIFRGGKIVNIDNLESKQIDILLTSKNTIKIFRDKGIYPIESVYGVFTVTATLDHSKLHDCIEELKSIPKQNPKFTIHPLLNSKQVLKKWTQRFPYKCIFGFTGDINQGWCNELNQIVKQNPTTKEYLPDSIVVNKKGVINKIYDNDKPRELIGGGTAEDDFFYTDFDQFKYYRGAIQLIANDLFVLSSWQQYVFPSYHEYFNKDLAAS